jgi:hypothetical protein
VTRIVMAAALIAAMSAFALGQQKNGHPVVPGRAEQELVALSRKAVADCIGKQILTVEDAASKAPPGAMAHVVVKGEFDAVELTGARTRIDGELAVVTGRVVFKGGPPEWEIKEPSVDVTIRFSGREGRWKFVGLCMGKCAAE